MDLNNHVGLRLTGPSNWNFSKVFCKNEAYTTRKVNKDNRNETKEIAADAGGVEHIRVSLVTQVEKKNILL